MLSLSIYLQNQNYLGQDWIVIKKRKMSQSKFLANKTT